MEIMDSITHGKILMHEREIRHLQLRKKFPDKYKNSVPMTDFVIDEMIMDLEQKIRDLKYRTL
jgi:hypothetical protein